jgi:predicted acylesterase/phospholipase RssA
MATPCETPSQKVKTKPLNLALQGGGAHCAFTWGVLDRLLEDDRIGFDGISATSAGAMNATVFASGMAAGGREGAKKALTEFWHRISHAALKSPLQPTLLDRLLGDHSKAQSRGFVFSELLTRLFLPYEFDPLNRNHQDLRQFRDRCGRGARFGLFAVPLPGRRDRRRGLLGRRLCRQPAYLPADLQLLERRCPYRAAQPDAEGGTAAERDGDPQPRQ